jgi:hypothetical protein
MQVAIATATEAVALPRVDCDAPVSINRVSRLQLWHMAPVRGDSKFGRLWSEADVELPLPKRIYECTFRPVAANLWPRPSHHQKYDPPLCVRKIVFAITCEGNRAS